jgi:hypothetical protein
MYSWLWRVLPGKRAVKMLQVAVLIGLVLAGLYYFVFPWLDAVLYSEPSNGI